MTYKLLLVKKVVSCYLRASCELDDPLSQVNKGSWAANVVGVGHYFP